MPKEAERKLRAVAEARGYDREHTDRYVYGTLRKINARLEAARKRDRARGNKEKTK